MSTFGFLQGSADPAQQQSGTAHTESLLRGFRHRLDAAELEGNEEEWQDVVLVEAGLGSGGFSPREIVSRSHPAAAGSLLEMRTLTN